MSRSFSQLVSDLEDARAAVARLEELLGCQHDAEPEEPYCHACEGTGIGRGDPDTSKCGTCHGRGYPLPERACDEP